MENPCNVVTFEVSGLLYEAADRAASSGPGERGGHG
jgi:hypothetical protein